MQKPLEEVQADIFKALGHPTRIKMVSIIAEEGEKCVCELVDRLGFDQSTISKHLSVLKSVGILKSTKQGLNVHYDIGMPCVVQFLKCVECLYRDSKDRSCDSCKVLDGGVISS